MSDTFFSLQISKFQKYKYDFCFFSPTNPLLQIKGNAINNLLARLTPSLEYLEDGQRDDVQQKVDLLRQQWIELKNYVIARVDLLKLYIRFHQEAETVRNLFDAYQIQRDTFRSGENDKPLLQAALDNIRQQLAQLGPLGGQFRECAAKVGWGLVIGVVIEIHFLWRKRTFVYFKNISTLIQDQWSRLSLTSSVTRL